MADNLPLKVLNTEGVCTRVEAKREWTAGDLKNSYCNENGSLNPDEQLLVFRGTPLQDSTPLGSVRRLESESTLLVGGRQRSTAAVSGITRCLPDDSLPLRVLDMQGRYTSILAKRSWSVSQLKEAYSRFRGIISEDQQLVFRGTPLEDNETLGSIKKLDSDSVIVAGERQEAGHW